MTNYTYLDIIESWNKRLNHYSGCLIQKRFKVDAGRRTRHIWLCVTPGSKLEVVEDLQGSAYRAVYTVKIAGAVYVLHCFQKKSKQGIATPKPDIEVIRERLKTAEMHAKGEK